MEEKCAENCSRTNVAEASTLDLLRELREAIFPSCYPSRSVRFFDEKELRCYEEDMLRLPEACRADANQALEAQKKAIAQGIRSTAKEATSKVLELWRTAVDEADRLRCSNVLAMLGKWDKRYPCVLCWSTQQPLIRSHIVPRSFTSATVGVAFMPHQEQPVRSAERACHYLLCPDCERRKQIGEHYFDKSPVVDGLGRELMTVNCTMERRLTPPEVHQLYQYAAFLFYLGVMTNVNLIASPEVLPVAEKLRKFLLSTTAACPADPAGDAWPAISAVALPVVPATASTSCRINRHLFNISEAIFFCDGTDSTKYLYCSQAVLKFFLPISEQDVFERFHQLDSSSRLSPDLPSFVIPASHDRLGPHLQNIVVLAARSEPIREANLQLMDTPGKDNGNRTLYEEMSAAATRECKWASQLEEWDSQMNFIVTLTPVMDWRWIDFADLRSNWNVGTVDARVVNVTQAGTGGTTTEAVIWGGKLFISEGVVSEERFREDNLELATPLDRAVLDKLLAKVATERIEAVDAQLIS